MDVWGIAVPEAWICVYGLSWAILQARNGLACVSALTSFPVTECPSTVCFHGHRPPVAMEMKVFVDSAYWLIPFKNPFAF